MKLHEIARLLKVPCKNGDIEIKGISIDTRKLKPQELFIALSGERFDGHQFINDAVKLGATAILCSKPVPDMSVEQLVVPNTEQALAMIARYHREKINCPVIALTGSNGKTSTKEMIASILPQPAHASPGNLNNHIGVPLSVLQLTPAHHYAVFELGANHPGEIAHTVAIVRPQVTLINNIAPAHIEGFGSIEGVARAKGEIHQGLINSGTAVINDDDAYAHFWDDILKNKKVLRFSIKNPADLYATSITYDEKECGRFQLVTPAGEISIQLQVPGAHNVSNAVAAASCAFAVGIDLDRIATGLHQFKGVSGRMTYLPGKNNSLVIDDTYNANLRSVLTALEVLGKYKGKKIFVFGDMGELGMWAKPHHEEVGVAARKQGVYMLLTCGVNSEHTALAFGTNAKHYTNQNDLLADLLPQLEANTTILVKGSRSAGMEKIVAQLVN
ncbi:UDP-N-acetylmuramoyl-tripeptide--D-alanyl-D-alanine ligase [Legionella adelaidensis]|nr:UDP-N-acetylmuramoyl-tripeptide--D-alanyl-D-alanine ligase [Legionella adelaidensis]